MLILRINRNMNFCNHLWIVHRNTIWPDGKRSNNPIPREESTKQRTRMAAKVALFALLSGMLYRKSVTSPDILKLIFLSFRLFSFVCLKIWKLNILFGTIQKTVDDLKHVVGSETTRFGLLNCFSMWQHKTLNMRLVLVLFNEILTTLYQTDDLAKHTK